MANLKYILYGVLALWVGYSVFFSSDDSESEQEWVTEEVVTPTEGMITTMQEVSQGEFKIADETVTPNPADSRIIANYMDGTIDTFTLAEAQMLANADNTTAQDTTRRSRRGSSLVRMAMWGYFGYMMGRSTGPRAGAYVDNKTYNKVSNGAGQRMNSTMQRTTTRKPTGKSGYGSGKSTRSYGG